MFTKKNLIILIGKQSSIAFIAIACAFGATSFLSKEIDKISNTIVQNHQLSDKLSKRMELFSTLKHDMVIVGENDTILEQAFIPADNILGFIVALKDIANKNNVTQSFNFNNPVTTPEQSPFPLSTINYQNTLSLNITSLNDYLRDFEQLPYFTRIDSLSFTTQDASGWQKNGTATYRAVLYTKTSN